MSDLWENDPSEAFGVPLDLDEILLEFAEGVADEPISTVSLGVAKAKLKLWAAQETDKARLDELNHVQLEYGGRFVATTYIDGDGQTITARIEDLKALTADKGQAALANVDTNQTQRYMDGFYSGKGQA